MPLVHIIVAVLLVPLALYLNHRLKHRRKLLPPGPWGLPVVGYLPFLNPTQPHCSLADLSRKFGSIYSIQLGSIFTVVLTDVKLVRQALALESLSGRAPLYLTHGIMKGNVAEQPLRLKRPAYPYRNQSVTETSLRTPLWSEGATRIHCELSVPGPEEHLVRLSFLFYSNTFRIIDLRIICVQGEKWKEQRKFVINCLRNFGMVKFGEKRNKMESDIKKAAWELASKLEKEEGKPLDPEHLLMHSLGNVVFNLVFGKTWEEEDEIWKTLISLQEEGTKLIGVAGPINFLPFLRFLPKYKKIIKYIEDGISFSHGIYERILEEHRKNHSDDEKEEAEDFPHFMGCFNREMLKRKEESSFYTLSQFNYLMADLWGAGVDTTITTLRWFFLYMAHYTEYQNNIQKEIDEVLGEKKIALNDIPFLPFLQAAMSEVQRIRSVTPLGIPHGAIEDCTLNGYHIPKGTMIVPLQWAIHMNPEIYPNPNTYNPNRFLSDEGKFTKPDAFIPFQTGKRMCLGEQYASMMLFLYAGIVLQKFTLCLEKQVDFKGEVGITLTPKAQEIKFLPRSAHV